MALESKVKNQVVVKQFVKEVDNFKIDFGEVQCDADGKVSGISRGEIFSKDGIYVGDFSIYGGTNPHGDDKRISINVMFSHVELIRDILDSLTDIEGNDYEEVTEFAFEKRERELREQMEQEMREAEERRLAEEEAMRQQMEEEERRRDEEEAAKQEQTESEQTETPEEEKRPLEDDIKFPGTGIEDDKPDTEPEGEKKPLEDDMTEISRN